MARTKLLLDTNVVIDYLNRREPFYKDARLLMIAGRVGEFDLWITSSQVTDLIYILSEGGKPSLLPDVMERLRIMRAFIDVYASGAREVDRMLSSGWRDPEDSLIFEAAQAMKANAIITRNKADFETTAIKVLDCNEFFIWMKEEFNMRYDDVMV